LATVKVTAELRVYATVNCADATLANLFRFHMFHPPDCQTGKRTMFGLLSRVVEHFASHNSHLASPANRSDTDNYLENWH